MDQNRTKMAREMNRAFSAGSVGYVEPWGDAPGFG
jgi:hypothetical protein